MIAEKEIWRRIQTSIGVRPDGDPGIATATAIADQLKVSLKESVEEARNNQWPRDNNEEMVAFYGERGSGLTSIVPPYPLYYEGKQCKTITVHQKIASAVTAALAEVLKVYGLDTIKKLKLDQFDGCFNIRPKRGGASWSVHSYAAAFDFNAEDNMLHQDHTTARFAKPEYEAWFRAWERQGFVSLGRQCDMDWMHVQAARIN